MADADARLGTLELSADEISDAVWLAGRIAAAGDVRPDPPADSAEPAERTEPPPPPVPAPQEEPSPTGAGTQAGPAPGGAEPPPLGESGNGWVMWPRGKGPDAGRGRPGVPGLPPGLGQALRPLNRRVLSAHVREVDEEETAVATAESGAWFPVYRPARARRFDAVLVADTSRSMGIWDRTVGALRELLAQQGAFRDVKSVSMDTDDGDVSSVQTASGVHRPPAQLADPTGRRIVLVVTDGVGLAWRTGAIARVLAQWARTCRVALVHVLPTERWEWSGIRVRPRVLHTVAPGAANPVPVLALDRRHLRRWAGLVASDSVAGVRLAVLQQPSDEDGAPAEVAGEPPATERLGRFLATATPGAARLAGLLAAAPLTLPVMRAVQGTLQPEGTVATLAEFLLSGLLHRVPASADSGPRPDYEFAPGLRPELLATISRDETAQVQRIVEDVLGPTVPAVRDLRMILAAPDRAARPVVTEHNASFLAIQFHVLRALAGPYARRANRLGEVLHEYRKLREQPPGGHDIRGPAGGIESRGLDDSPAPIESSPPSRGIPVTSTQSGPETDFRRSGSQPTVWGGVPLRNVNFTGRAELLESLREDLHRSTAAAVVPGALHGMAGIGKSQVAVEYVYRHADDYDLVWWIPSENPSEIQASLVRLAQRLNLPVEQSVATAVPAVLDALHDGEPFRRWLLVFDNADQPEDVRAFWPRRGPGHILVTSRNSQWSEAAQAVEVDLFRREESRELLQRRNADLTDTDADRLAAVLGDLPLAIEQAAAWRAETGMSADEYLELFEGKRSELLETRPPTDYGIAVEAAWNVSLDRIRRDNPGALELLEVCAFLSPEPISRTLFSGLRHVPATQALERLADPIQLGRAIREITRYSLAKIDHRNDTLQLHRLVQRVLQNKLDPDDQVRVRHTAHLLLANADPRRPDAVEHWPRYAELLPHVRVADARNCTDEWVRKLAVNEVVYLHDFGDLAGAAAMARELVEFWTEKLGESHIETLVVARWLSRCLRVLGHFTEGCEVGERALALMRETLGETHEETLFSMNGVAAGLRAKGEFQAAREMNEFAYTHAAQRFGEDDPATLGAANNYALSLRLVGDFRAARDLDEQTWRRKIVVLGEDHRHTLLTLDNWSVDLRETGDYVRARTEQEDTVRRLRGRVGDRHPMTLAAIKNLAVAYRKAGKHGAKARDLAKEAADGLAMRFGETHPDAMSAAMELSIEHRQDGNLQEARRLGAHVKGLYEQTWGPRHPFSLAAATNLAVTLRLTGALGQARELNEQALQDMRDVLGADHPFTLVCATNYASDLAAAGEFEAAYELDQNTLERSNRTLGVEHPSSLALVLNQALDLRGLGRTEEADAMQYDAVQRLRKVLGADHPAHTDALLNQRANCDIDPMQI